MNGRVPQPQGNSHPFYAPHGCYPCKGKDSWIAIVVRDDDEWERLCEVLDMPAFASDPRFKSGLNRWRNRKEINSIIASRTIAYERKELMAFLQEKNVPASALLSVPDLIEDEHLKTREYWDKINDLRPGFGSYICKGKGFTLSGTPMKTDERAPDLGEHNTYVFGELLGISDEELKALETKGIIGTVPTADVLERIPRSLPKSRQRVKENN